MNEVSQWLGKPGAMGKLESRQTVYESAGGEMLLDNASESRSVWDLWRSKTTGQRALMSEMLSINPS